METVGTSPTTITPLPSPSSQNCHLPKSLSTSTSTEPSRVSSLHPLVSNHRWHSSEFSWVMHLRDTAIPQPATRGPTCPLGPGAKIPWETYPSAHRKAHACYPVENGIVSTGELPQERRLCICVGQLWGQGSSCQYCRMLARQSLVP